MRRRWRRRRRCAVHGIDSRSKADLAALDTVSYEVRGGVFGGIGGLVEVLVMFEIFRGCIMPRR
jgi:hypothetical protein